MIKFVYTVFTYFYCNQLYIVKRFLKKSKHFVTKGHIKFNVNLILVSSSGALKSLEHIFIAITPSSTLSGCACVSLIYGQIDLFDINLYSMEKLDPM